MENTKPFKNLKVVELASVLAGPLVGRFFAELGAEVIKIENPITGGDVTRSWKNPNEEKTSKTSAYFASANFGKKHIFCNLKTEGGLEEVKSYCKKADIIIVNFKPGEAARFGLDYDSLKKVNNSFIFGEIIGFSEKNHRPAYDMVLQAESGFLSMSGFPQLPYAKMPVALIDVLASHQLKEGLLIALLQKGNSESTCKVSVSLLETAISSLVNQASNWLNSNFLPQPMGSQHPNIAPYGDVFYTTENKPFLLAIGNNKQFNNLCELLKFSENFTSEFSENYKRVNNRDVLNKAIQDAVSKFTFKKLSNSLLKLGIPYGEIKNLEEVFKDENISNLISTESLNGENLKSVNSITFKISN